MANITLSENLIKKHIEVLETIAQMLIKEAEMLRSQTKVTDAKASKRKSEAEREFDAEIHRQRYWRMRYRLMMKKLKTPEEQERLREFAKKQNIII